MMRSNHLATALIATLLPCFATAGHPGPDHVEGDLIQFSGAPGNPNGAWCWFQDERAIVNDRHPDGPMLMFTSISASENDEAEQGDLDFYWYALDGGDSGWLELHDRLGQDDHNLAALYLMEDGRTLAAYAGHNDNRKTYARLSEPHQPAHWGDAIVYAGEAKSTYNNLLTAGSDLSLLNLSRLQGWDPNFLVWDHAAEQFRYGGRLLDSPGRPYLKYANSLDGTRVHVVATDQHPRDADNSLYHGVTDGRALYDSAGTVLDADIHDAEAVQPDTLTRVFAGDADNVAWVADVAVDSADKPLIAFSVQKDGRDMPRGSGGLDHRYHLARLGDKGWEQWEIAYAGERLYPGEDDYTGLVAIDPNDTDFLVISTNADPVTGEPLVSSADGQRHYELFAGRAEETGAPINWQPLTRNSSEDNIRPIIPAWEGERRVILWLRGRYTTYTDFDTQIVGLVQAR